MTDTTDIKALINDVCLAAAGIHNLGRSVSDERAQGVIDFIRSKLESAFEAERHRAADLVLHVNTQENMREKADSEIAELKAKLANPVVLQDFHAATIQSTQPFNLFDVIVATQGADAEAIIAAGFTVKGHL